jgi:hypothetical protein
LLSIALLLLLLLLLPPADAIINPTPQRVWPYLLLIAFAGMFALLGLRNLLILNWRCADSFFLHHKFEVRHATAAINMLQTPQQCFSHRLGCSLHCSPSH